MTKPAITENNRRALRVVDEVASRTAYGCWPARFAEVFWKDRPSLRRSGKCGRGSTRGVGTNLAAGSYLSKLERRGLLVRVHVRGQHNNGYRLSQAGRNAIKEDQS